MTDSSLNATEIAVGSLLAGGGYGNNGGGAWGGGYGSGFADLGSNAVRINRNAQQTEDQADCTRAVLGQSMDFNARAFESAKVDRSFDRICDRMSDSEFRQSDRLRDQDREIAANAKASAECYCKLELENCRNTAALTAEIKAVESRTIARELDKAEREIIYLRTTCGAS